MKGNQVILCPFSPAFQSAGQVLAACLAPQAGSLSGTPGIQNVLPYKKKR